MVTHQLQVERRTAKERWPETDVLPLSHVDQPFSECCNIVVYTMNENDYDDDDDDDDSLHMNWYAVGMSLWQIL